MSRELFLRYHSEQISNPLVCPWVVIRVQYKLLANIHGPADRARHDKMVALVERMLGLNKKKRSAKLAPSELDRIEREIATTDQEIDELVYELYGITDGERKIVEEAR